MKKTVILTSLIAGLFLVSCNKAEGLGGTSSIEGFVYVKDINGAGDIIGEYYGADEDVYIIYGTEDNTYDDDYSTSYDGSFRFSNLMPGDYTVFVYSRCDTCDGEVEAIRKTINISDKKTAYSVGTIEIYK